MSSVSLSTAELMQHRAAMESMLDDIAPVGGFSHTAVSHGASLEVPSNDVVILLTGTTGFLGSAALQDFINCPSVKRVYALNRSSRSGRSLSERQLGAPANTPFDPTSQAGKKAVLVEADITAEGFSMDPGLLEEIRENVTHIVHNAWRVHLALPVNAFSDVLRGMRTLIDFAITAPRCNRFVFVSSISTCQNIPTDIIAPETAVPIDFAIGRMGYGESKWIGEAMLLRAASETGLKAVIARTGQIAGSEAGPWKPGSWVSLVIKTSIAIGSLPTMNDHCNWVTLETAAGALVDLTLVPVEGTAEVVHVIHPRPIPLDSLFEMCGNFLGLPLISLSSWLDRMQLAPQRQIDAYPAHKVISMLKVFAAVGTRGYFPEMMVERGPALSKTMREAEELKLAIVRGWLQYWIKTRWIQSKPRPQL
ncbi:NAD(P)-binding protein [Cylindrobasidium torrendii FP15055 ss-10]|uniref:NAD(P)-binding protein n=1 Tax=Cylindrobasidium torrendii FP15055 ss-10 TaxID=1314674 RepID=A0A0D7BQT7_9AGAR|nr:NAD(P)-binding protein [Cylindrobasidium torrendii FP15055 ss-10]